MTAHLKDWEEWIRPTPLSVRLARKTKPGDIPQSRPGLGPCLIWTGHVAQHGYGVLSLSHKLGSHRKILVHRLAYELVKGEIPEGLDIDHLCSNRVCVNPNHLEPVTRRENFLRANQNAGKTHCPKGHPYSPENTYLLKGRYGPRRVCKTCKKEHDTEKRNHDRLAYNERKRDEARKRRTNST